MALASTVAVVVPSPATSLVLLATSWTRLEKRPGLADSAETVDEALLTERQDSGTCLEEQQLWQQSRHPWTGSEQKQTGMPRRETHFVIFGPP